MRFRSQVQRDIKAQHLPWLRERAAREIDPRMREILLNELADTEAGIDEWDRTPPHLRYADEDPGELPGEKSTPAKEAFRSSLRAAAAEAAAAPVCRDMEPEEVPMPFGKHKGRPLGQIDNGYLTWALDGAARGQLKRDIEAVLRHRQEDFS
jgi:uncharacterized protein (DUF3820 family)